MGSKMKKITAILIIAFLPGCSPVNKAPVEDSQITELGQDYAVALWKAVKAKTDGCSSPGPVKWIAKTFIPEKNWLDCCWQHDFDYHYGYLYGITREQADYELWECVDAGGNPVVARLIYTGVKIRGGLYYENGE
jgi:hypothetical protein